MPKWAGLLLALALLVLSGPLAAQKSAPYRYWEAEGDSLRRVLATQHQDTARLRTLQHLSDLDDYTAAADRKQKGRELVALTRRLRRPDAAAYRLLYSTWQRYGRNQHPALAIDSLRAAIDAFDRVGRPVPYLLSRVAWMFTQLKQQEERAAYFRTKLALYQSRGARENRTICHHALAGYYIRQGDYNQGISHYLRAASLAVPSLRHTYANELKVVGSTYADWGNPAKALHYLRQSLAVLATLPRHYGFDATTYAYRGVAQAYRQLHDYPAALRYANLALVGTPADTTRSYAAGVPANRAYALVLKSAVLLDMHRPAEAAPLLARAQHLGDSLRLAFYNSQGYFELDATWARYYTARAEPARAETAWLTAYRKARQSNIVPLRRAYLRELANHYDQRAQPALAARYYRAATALADTLEAAQGALHVANFEYEQVDQAQTARIARLRESQLQDAARARRQQTILWAVLGGAVLLLGLAGVLYFAFRRSERLTRLVTNQKQDLQSQRDQLDASLTELRATQAQLIQKEKMASLGELTAGIAHEIQNPLNFVNNFSEVSTELVAELKEAQAAGDAAEMAALADDLEQNLGKISHHGRRAAAIVKGMLEHSRTSTGERAPTNLNQLAEEHLRLAYQGLRAKDKTFNAALETHFAPDLPLVEAAGADLGRVLLNLFGNAFYAVQQRQQTGEAGYQPTVTVTTKQLHNQVEIRVADNGTGIPADIKAKIFQPFFTTKPTGEGTGLGLSLSHDIIAQGHGGTLSVESEPGQGTEFLISLPN
ncbi:hypothetical protein GCM10022409_26670 [Hymenobacter glaciei]|uniref:histidine kinase n=1 Tax=Hymenobacter glaciei TaxID=877209 RepID=A0ABP7UBJ4_9BACT